MAPPTLDEYHVFQQVSPVHAEIYAPGLRLCGERETTTRTRTHTIKDRTLATLTMPKSRLRAQYSMRYVSQAIAYFCSHLYSGIVRSQQRRHDLRRRHPRGQIVHFLASLAPPISPRRAFLAHRRCFSRRLRRRLRETQLVPLELCGNPVHL